MRDLAAASSVSAGRCGYRPLLHNYVINRCRSHDVGEISAKLEIALIKAALLRGVCRQETAIEDPIRLQSDRLEVAMLGVTRECRDCHQSRIGRSPFVAVAD